MINKSLTKAISIILILSFLGCGTTIKEIKGRDTSLSLLIVTIPMDAKVYFNSQLVGQSPVRVKIPIVAIRKETERSNVLFFNPCTKSLLIFVRFQMIPISIGFWPIYLIVGAVSKHKEVMLGPILVAKELGKQIASFNFDIGRESELIELLCNDNTKIDLITEPPGKVIKKSIQVSPLIKGFRNRYKISPTEYSDQITINLEAND